MALTRPSSSPFDQNGKPVAPKRGRPNPASIKLAQQRAKAESLKGLLTTLPPSPLPSHHETFALCITYGLSVRVAAEAAGFSQKAQGQAYRLRWQPKIVARVEELRPLILAPLLINQERVLTMLLQDRALARELGQLTAAVKADEIIAKVARLIDVDGTPSGQVTVNVITGVPRSPALAGVSVRIGSNEPKTAAIEGKARVVEAAEADQAGENGSVAGALITKA